MQSSSVLTLSMVIAVGTVVHICPTVLAKNSQSERVRSLEAISGEIDGKSTNSDKLLTIETKTKSAKHAKSHGKHKLKSPKLKGSNASKNPMGTVVQVPKVQNFQNYDILLLDLDNQMDSKNVTKATTTSPTTTTATPSTTTTTPSTTTTTARVTTTTTTVRVTKTTTASPLTNISRKMEKADIADEDDPGYMVYKPGLGQAQWQGLNDKNKYSRVSDADSLNARNIKLIHGKQPEVTTKHGSYYRGKILTLKDNKEVYAFYGIPYAARPIGSLRFKRTEPVESLPLGAVFEATKINLPCFPSQHGSTSMSGAVPEKHRENVPPVASEDCLYLNIWLPPDVLLQNTSSLTSVIVWIHGGGFLSGWDTEDYGSGAFFVGEMNVILVSFQYRTGVFGFYHLGTNDAPGNMGLLDQIEALNWISSNIERFGGDPHSVTIIGHDIGAAFVGIHLISKISPSYFNRAVMLGGAPTQPHVFKTKFTATQAALGFAKELGCVNSESAKSIIDCLRNVEPFEIWQAQLLFHTDEFELPFLPTQDNYVIVDNPENLLQEGKGKICQIFVGGAANEGTLPLLRMMPGTEADKPTFVPYDRFIRIMSHVFALYEELELSAILHEYKNWENPENGYANQLKLASAIGDHFFTCPLRKFSDAWSGRGLNTYHFLFEHPPSIFNRSEWIGTVHGDEIDFFFGVPVRFDDNFTPKEVQLSKNMMKMLKSFIATGNPSLSWERYGRETPFYLQINATSVNLKTESYGPRAKECGFWNEFFPNIRSLVSSQVVSHSNSDYNIDDNCVVSFQNCSKSNFAIHLNNK